VFAGNRKLIGVSQRRTRDWIRIQTAVHRRWDPELLVAVLAPDAVGRALGGDAATADAPQGAARLVAALDGAVATVDAPAPSITDALLTALAA